MQTSLAIIDRGPTVSLSGRSVDTFTPLRPLPGGNIGDDRDATLGCTRNQAQADRRLP